MDKIIGGQNPKATSKQSLVILAVTKMISVPFLPVIFRVTNILECVSFSR